jgi:hypothetical protein
VALAMCGDTAQAEKLSAETWRFICAVWLIFVYTRAGKQWLSFRKSSIIRAPIGALPGHTRIGGSTTRFRIWGWRAGYAYMGETAKARKAFQDFFQLWKDADPGIPVLLQARAEYAQLR